MENKLEFFMLTDQNQNYANVYTNFQDLKKDYTRLKDKLPLKTWILKPDNNPDLFLAQIDHKFIVCEDPVIPIKDRRFIPVMRLEIKVH